jgi:PAS domain-containing protein
MRDAATSLEASEWRYRQLVNAVIDYAIFQLDIDGHVTTWNPAPSASRAIQRARFLGNILARSTPMKIALRAFL